MIRYGAQLLSAACLAVLAVIGLFAGPFVLYIAMRVMILSIFALGYNLLLGRTGLLSFGHAAFFATGAYGLALCSIHINPHPLLGILVGVSAAALLALLIGFFCVRHTEIYFAMLTLAFGMMVFSLMWNVRSVTGGDDGLYGITRTAISLGIFKIPIIKEYQVLLFCASRLRVEHVADPSHLPISVRTGPCRDPRKPCPNRVRRACREALPPWRLCDLGRLRRPCGHSHVPARKQYHPLLRPLESFGLTGTR